MRFWMYLFCTVLFLLPYGGVHAQSTPRIFENWAVRCEDDQAKKRCEVFQRLLHRETQLRVMEFAIGYPDAVDGSAMGAARGVAVLPHGLLLQDGATVKIDDGQVFKFVIRTCLADGCYGYLSLNDFMLQQLRGGKEITFGFKTVEGEPYEIVLSLKGISAALDHIK